jgi:signal peptide peptidase SppA
MSGLSNTPIVYWLGSQESYETYRVAVAALAKLEALGPDALKARILQARGGRASDNPFELPPMYEVRDGVAILHVQGPLVSGSAGFLRLFGITGYDDIRAAAREAMSQKSVKSMLLHVASPGGHVAGAEETSNDLRFLGQTKPIITYSDSVMASAGYWVGSAGRKLLGSKTGTYGSVGVIGTHVDQTKADEQAGLKYTVVRAGEYKQLANPHEPLSEEAKAEMKARAEAVYDVFADGISANLGMSRADFDKKLGRGREFLGVQAVEVGMIHQLATFEEAFNMAKNVDTSKLNGQNSRQPNKGAQTMKATLATTIILQLMAGTVPSTLDLTKAEATAEGVVPDAEAQTFLKAQAIEIADAAKTATSQAVAEATAPLNARITELTATVGVRDTELAGLRATSTATTEKLVKLEGAMAKAEDVFLASLAAMNTALGFSADAGKDLKGEALVAEHDRVKGLFTAKFPTARVTAITAETSPPQGSQAAGAGLPAYALVASRLRQNAPA